MTDRTKIIDGKECKYWLRPNPTDYRKCSLRGENDNCDEIKDCFVKELLGKLAQKEQECEKLYIQLKTDEEYHKEEENTLRKIIKNKEERNIELYKENKKYKQVIDEIEINISEYQGLTFGKPRTMRENDCIYKILDIINKAKERK